MIYDDVVEPLLKMMVPNFYLIDQCIFVDTTHSGIDKIMQEIERNENVKEAQRWINICLFESYLDVVFGDNWNFDDPKVSFLLEQIKSSWKNQIKSTYPDISFQLEVYSDEEYGDLGLRLTQ